MGKDPNWDKVALASKTSRTTTHALEILVLYLNRFQWGMVFKHCNYPEIFYYDNTLTTAQVIARQVDVDGKNR